MVYQRKKEKTYRMMIAQMLAEGKSKEDICAELGANHYYVLGVVEELSQGPPPMTSRAVEKQRLVFQAAKFRNKGYYGAQIAELMKVSPMEAHRLIEKAVAQGLCLGCKHVRKWVIITPEQKKIIQKMWIAEAKMTEIADAIEQGDRTTSKAVREMLEAGQILPRQEIRKRAFEDEELMMMLAAGMNRAQIAAKFGCTRAAVGERVRRLKKRGELKQEGDQ